ncbi:MAG: DUF72 domain-containing protein [Thermoplasmatota archaeon]
MVRVRLGLAAWSNHHFDNALYPIGTPHATYLPRYASLFDTAEADILFHRAPSGSELAGWVEGTPAGFTFLPKLARPVSHAPRESSKRPWMHPVVQAAPEPGVQAAAFAAAVAPLAEAGKLGPILVQLAPDMTRLLGWDRLTAILQAAPAGTWAVEFRHPSWFVPAVEQLLEEHESPLVWSTFPKAFAPPWRTAGVGYVRFTGRARARRGRHVTTASRTGEVREAARRIQDAAWPECFAIVTNGFEGNAVDSLAPIAHALGATRVERVLRARQPGAPLFPDPR